MARLRTTVNRITERIETDRRRSTRTVCKYGIPLVLLASVLIPVCIPFWAIIWFAIYQSVKKGGSAVMLAGAAGEDHALAQLSSLSDEYTVYNQICLPDSRSRTGYREADFVVVGPNGVVIIENKDYRGRVEGDWNSDHWEIHKIGRCGTPYTKSCRNPVRQVQVYVSLLAGIFSSRDIKAWITPMVSLSRDNSLGLINSAKVQVVRVADLCENILDHHGTLSKENMDKVIGLLEELRARHLMQAQETVSLVDPCWTSPIASYLSFCVIFGAGFITLYQVIAMFARAGRYEGGTYDHFEDPDDSSAEYMTKIRAKWEDDLINNPAYHDYARERKAEGATKSEIMKELGHGEDRSPSAYTG